jgi:hypothetical protein
VVFRGLGFTEVSAWTAQIFGTDFIVLTLGCRRLGQTALILFFDCCGLVEKSAVDALYLLVMCMGESFDFSRRLTG